MKSDDPPPAIQFIVVALIFPAGEIISILSNMFGESIRLNKIGILKILQKCK
jgi:hypothetical protein